MSDSTPETLFESHLELAAKIGREALNKGFTLFHHYWLRG
jgi:hypothetical protein